MKRKRKLIIFYTKKENHTKNSLHFTILNENSRDVFFWVIATDFAILMECLGCEFPEEPLEGDIAPQELLSSTLSEFPCETHRYQKVNSGVTILQNPGEWCVSIYFVY